MYSFGGREHDDGFPGGGSRVAGPQRRHDNAGGYTVDDKTEKELHGDYAAGERTKPLTPEAEESALLEGDFAGGERTRPLTEEERREAELHGDFAAGERSKPLTPESSEEGSFAPHKK
jgi:hypothetical protein